MNPYTHEIVRMERSKTKNSGSPMWYCLTKDGQRVNVFQHSDPNKDNTAIFREAGYFDLMDGLKIGEALEWSAYPVQVMMTKDGQWWSVAAVAPRPDDAEPDALWMPDLAEYRKRAVRQAIQIVNHAVRIFDVETTGLRSDDEIISISILDENSQEFYDTRIQPNNPEKLLRVQKDGLCAAQITGITPEDLAFEQPFRKHWMNIHKVLDGSHWCAYNAGFDVAALDRACSNEGLPLLTNSGVFDAAVIAAEYLGNWNPKRQWFEMLKLADAATQLGIMMPVAHQAGADARATYDILKAIAADVLNPVPF